jgi:hypothetical protein
MAKKKKKLEDITQADLLKGTRRIEVLRGERTFVPKKNRRKSDVAGRKAKHKGRED